METLELTLRSISESKFDKDKYCLRFAEQFEAISGTTRYVSMYPNVILRQCSRCVKELEKLHDFFITKNSPAFLGLVLINAKITLERERFEKGDVFCNEMGETFEREYSGYRTEIVDVELSESGWSCVNKLLDLQESKDERLIKFEMNLYDTGLSIDAFCSTYYRGYGKQNNPDYINTLKNQFGDTSNDELVAAKHQLEDVLKKDIPKIIKKVEADDIVVCVVPRAKAEDEYESDQKLFREAISEVVQELSLIDGSKYIVRVISTYTTHMSKVTSYINEGEKPRRGLLKDTSDINEAGIRGRNVLLIDDVYTRGAGIDEDAALALLEKGAKSVTFYAIGFTSRKLD